MITGSTFKCAETKNFTYCFFLPFSNERFLVEGTLMQISSAMGRGGYLGRAKYGTLFGSITLKLVNTFPGIIPFHDST